MKRQHAQIAIKFLRLEHTQLINYRLSAIQLSASYGALKSLTDMISGGKSRVLGARGVQNYTNYRQIAQEPNQESMTVV